MKTRRDFLKVTGFAGLAGFGSAAPLVSSAAIADADRGAPPLPDREYWLQLVEKLARPVLEALASNRLKQTMPIETGPAGDPTDRSKYAHLEALGRLLCGIAPWLELGADSTAEGQLRSQLSGLARKGIDAATDPQSPDFMNFTEGGQPLVDAAFLAQAFIRAPIELWARLDPRVQRNVIAALKMTRRVEPAGSNWILFCAEVEAWLHQAGEPRIDKRITDQLLQYDAWYLGDGMYGDGPQYHCDYYNSFVIQPMLFDVVETLWQEGPEFERLRHEVHGRLGRYAEIQERSIASDGSFPPHGRSITYRCGAFQGLALAALKRLLPESTPPGQARVGLTSVLRRTLSATENWDENGWLRIGLSGHQPALAERYICTGSLYLCSAALLPLGLPPSDPFWTDPAQSGSWEQNWSGADVAADAALR